MTRSVGAFVKTFLILLVVVGIACAILSLYGWDPVTAVATLLGKVSDFFLQFAWFRDLFGPGR